MILRLTVQIGQLHRAHGLNYGVIGGSDVLKREAPVHRMIQLAFRHARGNPRHLAHADATAQSHDPGEQGGMGCRLPDMGLLPMLEGKQHSAVIVDGFQNLRERHIVPLRKEIAQWVGLTGIDGRCANVERPILAQLQVGIVGGTTIRCLVLGGERGIQRSQYGGRISEFRQTCPLQQMALFALPTIFIDQVSIHGSIFVGLFHVEVAGFDGRSDGLK